MGFLILSGFRGGGVTPACPGPFGGSNSADWADVLALPVIPCLLPLIMPDVVLQAEPYGSLLFAPEVPCIVVQWHGFANSQQFRGLMDDSLTWFGEQAQQTWPLGWLMDARLMSAISPVDQLWLETDWNPRAYAAGLRHIGIVSAENIFGRIATQVYIANTVAQSHYTLEPASLATPEEARRWIQYALAD